MMTQILRNRLRKWRADEDGSIAIETILMVPLMAWAFVSTLAFFDAYRSEAISEKASLTIADMLSRETGYVTPEYLNGTHELLKFLTAVDDNPSLRVSVISWIAPDPENAPRVGAYQLVWSDQRGPAKPILTTPVIQDLTDRLPLMTHNERLILVETWTEYHSHYDVGLKDFTQDTYTFISPRFASQLCFNLTPLAGQATAIC